MLLTFLAILLGVSAKHRPAKREAHKNGRQKQANPRKTKVDLTSDIKRSIDRMTMGLPLYVKTKGMVIPQSMPQIDAPRLVVNNLPRPSQAEHQYPYALMANTPGTPPPMTVLPPKFVTAESFNMYEKEKNDSQNPKVRRLRQKKSSKQHRNASQKPPARKLNAFPFINPGPGFIDLGSNGYSPMSFSALRPQLASMAPFIPRNSAPPPLRLQLRDPVQETYKKNIMTESEKQMSISENESLIQSIVSEIKETENLAKTISGEIQDHFREIDKRVEQVKESRNAVTTEVQKLKAEMAERKSKLLENKKEEEAVKKLSKKKERRLMDAYDYRDQAIPRSKRTIL